MFAWPLLIALSISAPSEHPISLQSLEAMADRGAIAAEPAARQLIDTAQATQDVETGVWARLHLLRYYRLRNAWSEIPDLAKETVAMAHAGGLDALAARAKLLHVGALVHLEQSVEAQTMATEVLDFAEGTGDTALQARALLTLSSIAARANDLVAAKRHIDTALLKSGIEPEVQIRLLLNRSLVAGAMGDEPARVKAIDDAAQIRLPKPIPELEQTLLLARLALWTDEPKEALALTARAADDARASGNFFLAAFADAARARRLCQLGDIESAMATFESALSVHVKADNALEQSSVLDAKAACLQSQGLMDEAFAALSAARTSERLALERQRGEVIATLNAVRREQELSREIDAKAAKVAELQSQAIIKQRDLLSWTLLAIIALGLATLSLIRARSNAALARALQNVQDSRSDMLAVAGHEIRNPIQGLMGALTALLHNETDPGRRQLMATAHRAVQTIARISNDAFDLSLMDKNQFVLHKRDSRLIDILTSARDWVMPAAEAKGLAIELSYPESDSDLRAEVDAERLGQVVLNLLTNAVRYTSGGVIRVSSATRDDRWLVSVTDQGPGIRTADMPRLFDAYFRGVSAGNEQGGGLGLSVAKRIVAAHGGQIDARNLPQGGAEFYFSLPLITSRPPALPAVPETMRPLEGLRLLIVDDDELVRLAVRVNAEIAGAIVQELDSGERLLKTLREFDPDVVLSDKQLVDEDGIELLRAVREAFPGRRPALALMTGSVHQQKLEAPIERVLIKPFTGETLVEALTALRVGTTLRA